MIKFPNRPRLEVLDADWFRLIEDWNYQWYHAGRDWRLVVRAGFECDLASVPKFLHSFIGRKDLGLGPPLLHDMIYACRGNVFGARFGELEVRERDRWVVRNDMITRRQADRIFGRQMRELQVPIFKRRMAYRMVRVFGWPAWIKTRPGDARP